MYYPEWLPELFSVDPWREKTYEELYSLFEKDFKGSQPKFEDKVIWFFPDMEDGKERIFWHLTSREDKETGQRLPDLRRCERLPWVRPILDHPEKSEVLVWDHREGDGDVKTYFWVENFNFVVILKKYPDGNRRLITSFWLEYDNTKKKLRKKFESRISHEN
uniref:Phage P1-related protein n=1 Tax=Leptospirillum sp. Group II '5-way CG' TaxID=419541 RepID=B6AN46_9BACT|nr:MAG: Hypothetical protein CGL2_11389059a [Leptospirillum sp. Group II '5-way CG']